MAHPISIEQVLLAKRTSMERFFFIPSAEDRDNGFNRLMTMESKDEIEAASKSYETGWGGIYLEESWKGHELANIQKWVLKGAVELISVMCRVSPEAALAAVQKHPEVHGQYGRCAKWKIHSNLRYSDSATCFQCDHFHQPIGDDGESPWTLDFDDRGTCLIGMTNDD